MSTLPIIIFRQVKFVKYNFMFQKSKYQHPKIQEQKIFTRKKSSLLKL